MRHLKSAAFSFSPRFWALLIRNLPVPSAKALLTQKRENRPHTEIANAVEKVGKVCSRQKQRNNYPYDNEARRR